MTCLGEVEEQRKASTSFSCLVVDDEISVAQMHAELLRIAGYHVFIETNPLKIEKRLSEHPEIQLVLLDMRMPQMTGTEVLERLRVIRPDIGVIISTVVNDIELAVKATKMGAYNYLLKPLTIERLAPVVQSFAHNRPKNLESDPRFSQFITCSPQCKKVFKRLLAFSSSDAPVLIQGETGVGKDVIARIIHGLGPRRLLPFVAVNVAALSPTIFESELFGHARGAFTGAIRDRTGYFSHAGNGTLFLDEIGELGLEQQTKLLRALESKKFSRVGDETEISLSARIVLATNRNLTEASQQGTFRSDLYYRFASHAVTIPPLRERTEDIPLLADYFIKKYAAQYGKSVRRISVEASQILQKYPFPGNVRELDGYISAAVLLEDSNEITPQSLPDHLFLARQSSDPASLKMQSILRALAETGGNQTRAAEKLGISRSTLLRSLKSSTKVSD